MKFYHNDIILEVPENVYYPREDSILMAGVLEKEDIRGKSCLDMGCGSGFLSIVMTRNHGRVTAVDINPFAVRATKQNTELNYVQINVIQSNLFQGIRKKFDLIIFNAPYIPVPSASLEHEFGGESPEWAAGTKCEIIDEFINNAFNYLAHNGCIFLLISSLTGKAYKNSKIIAREKLPWEELIILEFSR